MHIEVNATRLWFDVEGPALVPDGDRMRPRPTVDRTLTVQVNAPIGSHW